MAKIFQASDFERWDWNSTEESQIALASLQNKDEVGKFHYSVWNDLINLLKTTSDLLGEEIDNKFAWDNAIYQATLINEDDKTLYAYKFNNARKQLDFFIKEWSWKDTLGRLDFIGVQDTESKLEEDADIVKAEYFFLLYDTFNAMIDQALKYLDVCAFFTEEENFVANIIDAMSTVIQTISSVVILAYEQDFKVRESLVLGMAGMYAESGSHALHTDLSTPLQRALEMQDRTAANLLAYLSTTLEYFSLMNELSIGNIAVIVSEALQSELQQIFQTIDNISLSEVKNLITNDNLKYKIQDYLLSNESTNISAQDKIQYIIQNEFALDNIIDLLYSTDFRLIIEDYLVANFSTNLFTKNNFVSFIQDNLLSNLSQDFFSKDDIIILMENLLLLNTSEKLYTRDDLLYFVDNTFFINKSQELFTKDDLAHFIKSNMITNEPVVIYTTEQNQQIKTIGNVLLSNLQRLYVRHLLIDCIESNITVNEPLNININDRNVHMDIESWLATIETSPHQATLKTYYTIKNNFYVDNIIDIIEMIGFNSSTLGVVNIADTIPYVLKNTFYTETNNNFINNNKISQLSYGLTNLILIKDFLYNNRSLEIKEKLEILDYEIGNIINQVGVKINTNTLDILKADNNFYLPIVHHFNFKELIDIKSDNNLQFSNIDYLFSFVIQQVSSTLADLFLQEGTLLTIDNNNIYQYNSLLIPKENNNISTFYKNILLKINNDLIKNYGTLLDLNNRITLFFNQHLGLMESIPIYNQSMEQKSDNGMIVWDNPLDIGNALWIRQAHTVTKIADNVIHII